MYFRDGRVAQLEHIYIRGSKVKIRFCRAVHRKMFLGTIINKIYELYKGYLKAFFVWLSVCGNYCLSVYTLSIYPSIFHLSIHCQSIYPLSI